ncbi:LysR family transcriptional regulator [Bradyrhizobium sp. 186]|uniref:LysR family transcriptional regulator n=1 Tax=Bradyrhizobium sp. 186 TaxID=2782654 RepID=UPI002000ADAA|nr:LysR family transcriptional regulator [Bradyrhizobium sp. 186]UPK39839.1 LysR family transcriptional regulator [Bradyrhizobium sp. 186]
MDSSDRIGRLIKLRDLRILMAIADAGSMAKAAAKLRISHPAISNTISDLEGTLGVRLLDRGSRGAVLTAYGEVLLRCGVNIFDEMQQGRRSLEYLSDPNSGEVRLGCTDIILHSLVPTIVRRFSREHPGVQLDVKLTNPGEHQMQELRERRIDLLITRAPARQDDFNSEVLFDEPLVFVVGAHSDLARKRRTALKDIMEANWVLPPYDSPPGALVAAVFRANNISPPKPLIKTIAVQLTVSLIASGEFVGILPTSVAALSAHQSALKVLPLKSSGPLISAEIVFLRNRTLSPAVESFIKCTREVARSLVNIS